MPSLLVKMSKGINVSQLDQFTESLAWLRLKKCILLLVVWAEAINVLRNDVKVSPDHGRYFLFGERGESLFQSVHPGQLIRESVRPNRIAIGQIDINHSQVVYSGLQVAGMAVSLITQQAP